MERIVIEIKSGIVIGVSSTHDIEVYVIDYDTDGMDNDDLIEYKETIKIPSIVKAGNIQGKLDGAENFYEKEIQKEIG